MHRPSYLIPVSAREEAAWDRKGVGLETEGELGSSPVSVPREDYALHLPPVNEGCAHLLARSSEDEVKSNVHSILSERDSLKLLLGATVQEMLINHIVFPL